MLRGPDEMGSRARFCSGAVGWRHLNWTKFMET